MHLKLDIFITGFFYFYIDQLQKNQVYLMPSGMSKTKMLMSFLFELVEIIMASTKYSSINKYCTPIALIFYNKLQT